MRPTLSPNNSDACPTPNDLRDWLTGKRELSDFESAHLNECTSCQSLAETLSDAPDLQPAQSIEQRDSPYMRESELVAIRKQLKRQNHIEHNSPNTDSADRVHSAHADTNKELSALQPTVGNDEDRQAPADSTATPNPTMPDKILSDRMLSATSQQPSVPRQGTEQQAATTLERQLAETDPGVGVEQLQRSLPERYQLQKRVASGGSGVVFLGFDRQLDREVAIKILTRDSMRDRQRFQREAKLLASLEHANVIRIFDFGTLEMQASLGTATPAQYLVMEYVAGGCLANHQTKDGVGNWNQIAKYILHAAQGLAAAHEQGIVHRDVKPSNLLLSTDDQVKVADFGIARLTSPTTQVTHTGDLLGTPEFMSPEQVTPSADLTARTDVYGLGASLYYLLTGNTPFRGSSAAILRQIADVSPVSPRLLNPQIPVDLETICMKAMEKSPDDRYSSAHTLASDLQHFIRNEPISARPLSNWAKASRYLRQNPTLRWPLLAVAALTCILIAGSGAAAIVFAKQNRDLTEAIASSERSLRDALDAADELLVSVTTDVELLPSTPGSQQVSKQLLNKAKKYYLTCLQVDGDSPEVQFQFARARSGLSKIALRLGNTDECISEANAALDLLDQVESALADPLANSATSPPIAPSKIVEVRAQSLAELATALVDKTEHESALVRFDEAVQNIDRVLQSENTPDNAVELRAQKSKLLRSASIAAGNLGQVDEARSLVSQSIDLSSELVSEHPNNSLYRIYAAEAEYSLGAQCMRREGIAEGKEHLLRAISILDPVSDGTPGEIRASELQASIRMNLGQAESRLGNPEKAVSEFAQAIAQHERLMQLEPTVPAHRMARILAIFNSTIVDFELGHFETMAEKYHEILPDLDEFVQRNAENIDYQQTQSMVLSNLAIVNKQLGKLDEALTSLESATDSFRTQARLLDNAPDSMYPIALNLYEMSGIHMDLEQYDDATELLDQSDEVIEQILEKQADFFPALQHHADTLLRRSEIALGRKPPISDRAIAKAQESAAAFQELAEAFPEQPDLRISYAYSLIAEAEALLQSDDLPSTRETTEKAIDYFLPGEADSLDEAVQEVLADAHLILATTTQREIASKDPADRSLPDLEAQLEGELQRAKEFGADDETLSSIREE